jgi:hypothetical protein
MAKLESFSQTAPIKLLFIGDSGAGKTGALASLATAGYNLRIIDVDKGVPILANYLSDPNSQYFKTDPKAISRVSFVQVSDTMQNINGLLAPKKVEGWAKVTKLLINWVDGDENLGAIQSWGPQDILVIDSLSGLSKLALHYHLFLNGALGKARTQNEVRRDMGATQDYIRNLLDLLYDDNIKCNVIVISHITAVTEAGGAPKIEEGKFDSIPIGYPAAIGRALSPQIPRWFNNMLIARADRQGSRTTHKIYTTSQTIAGQIIAAKTSAPLKVKPEYPLETGLADFFAALRS